MFDTSKLPLGVQARLKRVFEKKTQKQLSEEIGISQQNLSFYETGRLSCTEEHNRKLILYVNS